MSGLARLVIAFFDFFSPFDTFYEMEEAGSNRVLRVSSLLALRPLRASLRNNFLLASTILQGADAAFRM